jgi:DNA-binding NarL/FixJ family response regulator
MQSTFTLALVRSAHPQWNALRGALTAPPALAIISDIGPTQPLDALAGRHPTVMLVTADLTTRPPVPLVRDLRALSPDSKIILLGATATLDGAALITLHDLGIRDYFVWEELHPKTVRRALLLVVEDEALVGSPIVLTTLRATLERRQGARIDGLVLTPAQRATWTRPPAAGSSPRLTPRQGEVAALLADGYTNAEIGQHLSISAETARKHVQTILHTFGVPSRRTFGRVYRGVDTRGRAALDTPEMDDHGGT